MAWAPGLQMRVGTMKALLLALSLVVPTLAFAEPITVHQAHARIDAKLDKSQGAGNWRTRLLPAQRPGQKSRGFVANKRNQITINGHTVTLGGKRVHGRIRLDRGTVEVKSVIELR